MLDTIEQILGFTEGCILEVGYVLGTWLFLFDLYENNTIFVVL